MNALLITAMIVGAWNLLNFLARCFARQVSYAYSYHIIIGIWAAIIYFGARNG